nr:hypothetical protein [Rhodothermus marinus]
MVDADPERGAFFPPTLLYCAHPFEHTAPHEVEASGRSTRSCPIGIWTKPSVWPAWAAGAW